MPAIPYDRPGHVSHKHWSNQPPGDIMMPDAQPGPPVPSNAVSEGLPASNTPFVPSNVANENLSSLNAPFVPSKPTDPFLDDQAEWERLLSEPIGFPQAPESDALNNIPKRENILSKPIGFRTGPVSDAVNKMLERENTLVDPIESHPAADSNAVNNMSLNASEKPGDPEFSKVPKPIQAEREQSVSPSCDTFLKLLRSQPENLPGLAFPKVPEHNGFVNLSMLELHYVNDLGIISPPSTLDGSTHSVPQTPEVNSTPPKVAVVMQDNTTAEVGTIAIGQEVDKVTINKKERCSVDQYTSHKVSPKIPLHKLLETPRCIKPQSKQTRHGPIYISKLLKRQHCFESQYMQSSATIALSFPKRLKIRPGSNSQSRRSLAATHPALYHKIQDVAAKKMPPPPLPSKLKTNSQSPFKVKLPSGQPYTDPKQLESVEPRFADPGLRMLKIDVDPSIPHVVSPVFMIGLPFGGMSEAAHIYPKTDKQTTRQ